MSVNEQKKHNTPNGWTLTSVAALAEVQTGPFGSQLHESDYVKEGTPIITVENLRGGVVRETETTPKVKDEDVKRLKKYTLKEGDVVFSRVGSVDRSAYVTKDKEGWMFSGRLLRVRAKKGVRPKFLNYELSLESTKNKVRNLAVGGTMPSLNTAIFSFVPVHSLPEDEQDRIVKVLETWDEAIEKLGQVIALKREVKKGLMQKLLTGELRLPGFKDNWSLVKLGDVTHIKTGKKDNQNKVVDGKYPFFVRSPHIERIDSYSYDGEAILVPGEGNVGEIFHYINGKFDYHQRVYKISAFKSGTVGRFVYYSLVKNFGQHVKKHSVKATVDSLRLPTFKEFEFMHPSESEQKAIVEVLDCASNEIDSLTKKLEYFQDQKKYLLNNLVTGQIRTPENL